VALAVAATGRFPVKAVAKALDVARSNLVDQLRHPERRCRGPYRREGDDELLAEIRAVTDARPTYGCRRVAALLNRARRSCGEPRVNLKRVFRLMRLGSLLLQPCTGRRAGRAHDGTVVAPASNRRWASDGFEVPCWNGEVVRAAFAIDTHDREVMAWVATAGAGISGEMVRDMMLECVERRFDAVRAPEPVQWLADNGSAYTAGETVEFATALNLVACFTPVRSPESNGVCEAFVKTFKRDYARVNPRPDAISVLQRLPAWFEDYNTVHPHSGLRMRSPREFIADQSSTPAGCPV
jgi:putative transposase